MAPNGMPIPGGHVILTLADGKRLNLPQTLSGSGIRYANADEFVRLLEQGRHGVRRGRPQADADLFGLRRAEEERALSRPARRRQPPLQALNSMTARVPRWAGS